MKTSLLVTDLPVLATKTVALCCLYVTLDKSVCQMNNVM